MSAPAASRSGAGSNQTAWVDIDDIDIDAEPINLARSAEKVSNTIVVRQ
jgi:hypothetical protein